LNWINSLSPLQWAIMLAIPPLIVLLYFLKLRRTPLEVPSTYLWMKAIEDMHVNSIWQRLRQNLLLLLQLLAVAGLILALLRPGCQGDELRGDRFIFLIDQSASMSATDLPNGSRLHHAKEQAVQMVDLMKPSDTGMVISFSDQAVVHQSYTKNKSLLKRKIKDIPQTERSTDLREALLAASGLANPGRMSDRESNIDVQVAEALEATLVVFSDGGVKDVPDFSLGNLTPEYRPIGSETTPDNVGITAFSINDQMEAGEQVQVFARLYNSGSAEARVDLELRVNDQLRDARAGVQIPAKSFTSLYFDLTDLVNSLSEPTPVRLKIENPDCYLLDNEASCVLNPPRVAQVLIVTDYNPYLKLVAQTERIKSLANIQIENRSFLEDRDYREKSTLGFYDLIIYDQCSPETPPAANAIYWSSLPNDGNWEWGTAAEATPITDFETNHPIMFAVGVGDILVASSRNVTGPQGAIPLIESLAGPIMTIATRGSFEDLVIGFPLVEYLPSGETSINSDWPRKLSFPIFVQNLMVYLGGGAKFSASRNLSPGEMVTLKPSLSAQTLNVVNPTGQRTTIPSRGDGVFVFSQTERTGVYRVYLNDSQNLDQIFAVNLLDARESDLEVRPDLNLGFNKVVGARSTEKARQEYWRWIVLGVLGLLLLEWYIYNRRVLI